jgi:hypothetical protein
MPITNGAIFKSPIAMYQILVQGREPIAWDVRGEPYKWLTELTAEFGKDLGVLEFRGDDQFSPQRFADIRGHFFDSAAQAEEKGWTQEEHDQVVAKVRAQCKLTPEYVQEVVPQAPAPPWPTYDQTPHGKIATLAESLGLAVEALTYERRTKARKTVLHDLEAIVNAAPATEGSADDAEEIVAA